MRTPRFVAVASLAVLLSALVGGIVGSSAQATQDQVSQQYRVFTAALAAVDREYVENVPSDRLIYDAVGGMLQTLDPHSSFFDPKQYAQMRERQEGKYYGLGISIQVIDGDITVMTLFVTESAAPDNPRAFFAPPDLTCSRTFSTTWYLRSRKPSRPRPCVRS